MLGAFAEPGVDKAEAAERIRPRLADLAEFVGVDGVYYGRRGNLMSHLRPSL